MHPSTNLRFEYHSNAYSGCGDNNEVLPALYAGFLSDVPFLEVTEEPPTPTSHALVVEIGSVSRLLDGLGGVFVDIPILRRAEYTRQYLRLSNSNMVVV